MVVNRILLGIGSIPDAVLSALTNHKDLGIHSEMFAAGVVDLVNRGCITNNRKVIHKGRIVGSFLIGTQELYDFVDNNPFIEMLVVDYVNNTSKQSFSISINKFYLDFLRYNCKKSKNDSDQFMHRS